jgi:hypothetical protein
LPANRPVKPKRPPAAKKLSPQIPQINADLENESREMTPSVFVAARKEQKLFEGSQRADIVGFFNLLELSAFICVISGYQALSVLINNPRDPACNAASGALNGVSCPDQGPGHEFHLRESTWGRQCVSGTAQSFWLHFHFSAHSAMPISSTPKKAR